MATIHLQEPAYKGAQGPVFFAAGFRPFFLFSGIQAVVMLPLWLLTFLGFLDVGTNWNPVVWHAHSMVFGFASAAIGGFLLALIETLSAKMRVFRAPEFLGTAFLLAVLAMLVHLLLETGA